MKKANKRGNLSISFIVFILISTYLLILNNKFIFQFLKNSQKLTLGYSDLSNFSTFLNLIIKDIKQADASLDRFKLMPEEVSFYSNGMFVSWIYKNNKIYRKIDNSRYDLVLEDVYNFKFDWLAKNGCVKKIKISGSFLKKEFNLSVKLINGVYE